MKKKVTKIILTTLIVFHWFQSLVFAQDLGNYKFPNPSKYNSLEEIINAAAGLIRPVFILTFGGLILYGAWLWLTSQGDDGKIKSARNVMVAAIIGFVLAVFATTIVNFLLGLLGVQGLNLGATG
jgi:hypothetical protein